MAMICPTCGNRYARLFFRDDVTSAAGYRCPHCSCTFIVLREGEIPESSYEDDDDDWGDHANNCWPCRND